MSSLAFYSNAVSAIGVACAAAMVACASPDLPDELVLESEHFRIFARPGTNPICRDVVTRMEEHLHGVHQDLGLPVPRAVFRFYKYRDEADYEANAPCRRDSLGCALPGEAHSNVLGLGHELVHLYLHEHTGFFPHPVLTEGIAQVFACAAQARSWPESSLEDTLALAERLASLSSSERDRLYRASLYFVSHILDRFGREKFLELYRSARSPARSAFRAAFEQVMGMPPDAVWDEAGKPQPSYVRPFRCPCTGPPLEFDRLVDVPAACETEFDHHPFPIAETTSVVLRAEWNRNGTTAAPRPLFQSCDGRQTAPGVFPLTGEATIERATGYSRLPPGRYFLSSLQGAGFLTVARSDWGTPACGMDMPVHTAAPGERLSMLPLTEGATHFFLDLTAAGTARANQGGVRICKDCQQNDCVSLAPWALLPKGRYVVSLDGGRASVDVVVPNDPG